MRWLLLLFVMLNFSCQRPQPTYPKHKDRLAKDHREKEDDERHVAPPPAYGHRVVVLDGD